ncbi:MAG: hypothetical protein AAFQ98_06530, partial [Bacteroidota bacterium]
MNHLRYAPGAGSHYGYARRIGVQDGGAQTFFTGYVHQLEGILPELDVLLMPSREEGLGTAIL